MVKNEKVSYLGLNSVWDVVHLDIEEERSFPPTHSTINIVDASADPLKLKRAKVETSRELKAAVLRVKDRPRLLDKKINLPKSANKTRKGRRSKDKKAGF